MKAYSRKAWGSTPHAAATPSTLSDSAKRLMTLWSGNSGIQLRILLVVIAGMLATFLFTCAITPLSLSACMSRGQVLPLGAVLLVLAVMATATIYAWVYKPENARQNQLRKELEAAALTDELTGLSNRRGLHVYLDRALQQVVRDDEIQAILVVDLNGFKAVNDRWGHDVGDALLIRVSRCLLRATRSSDLCARVGGDEFVVVLHLDTAEMWDARALARRIVERLADEIRGTFHMGGASVQIGVSIGICLFEACSIQFDEMFRQADKAMYRAKANPARDYCFYEETSQPMTCVPSSESRRGKA